MYFEPCQAPGGETFYKSRLVVVILVKDFISDVWQDCQYASVASKICSKSILQILEKCLKTVQC